MPGKECIDCGEDISNRGNRTSRCERCQTQHKKENDALRISKNREEFPDVELNKLGTTDLGSHLRMKDGEPDFEREAQIIHNEWLAVFGGNTTGYRRARYSHYYPELEPFDEETTYIEPLPSGQVEKKLTLTDIYKGWVY